MLGRRKLKIFVHILPENEVVSAHQRGMLGGEDSTDIFESAGS